MNFILLMLALTPVKEFKYAKGLFDDGLYDLAETELTDFINNYSNSIYAPEASVLLIKALNKQGKFEKTIVSSKNLLFKYPSKKEELLIEWGKAEIGLSHYTSAIEVIKRIQDRDKRELYLGETYYQKGDLEEALKHYSNSALPYSKLSAGWVYMELKDYKKAASVFSKLQGEYEEEGSFLNAKSLFLLRGNDSRKAFLSYVEKFPEGRYTGRAYSYLADINVKEENIPKAIQYLQKIPSLDFSLSGFSYYRIGLLYYEENNHEKAMEYFKKVEENDPYFWDAMYWRALILKEEGKVEESLANLHMVKERSPELRNEALFEMGRIYKNLGDYDQAKTSFGKIKGDLWDESKIEIGNILLKQENYREAYSEFNEVIKEKKGGIGLALFQAAIAKKKLHEFNNSLHLLETYEKNFPEGDKIDKVHLLKGDIYQNLEKYRNSLEEYDKININKSPELEPYVFEGKGWAWMGLKRYDMAFHNLEVLSEKFPDFCSRAEVYLQLGNAAYAMGDFKSAEQAYRQVKGERRPEALFNLAKMFFEKKEYNQAIEEFLNVKNNFSVSGYSEESSYYIALSLRKKDDLRASNKYLYSLISNSPDTKILAESFLMLGDNYFDQAKFDSSYKYYAKGFDVTLEKISGQALSSSALSATRGILLSVNNLSGSSEMEKQARKLIRRLRGTGLEGKVNNLIGNILFNAGKYDRAIDYLEDSDEPSSYYQVGLAFRKMERNQEAIQFLEKATKFEQVKDKAFLELGRIEFDSGNIEKAKKYFSESSLPESSLLYALCLKKENKEKEATARLLKLKGKVDGLAYIELAKTQIGQGELTSALKNLEEAVAFERAEAEAYYLMGKIFYDTRKEKEALEKLLKVKYLHPESEWVSPSLYLLAEIMAKRDEKERALNYLREIIERGEKPWVEKAQGKISKLKG